MAMAVVFTRNPMATKQINSGCEPKTLNDYLAVESCVDRLPRPS